MKRFHPFAAVLTLGLLLALSTVCHAAEPAMPAGQLTQLGAGDSVTVQIFGQPDLSNVYVGDDGGINLPLVGNVKVAGMSPVAAGTAVAKSLKDGGYYVDPHVNILVTDSRSQKVSVLGDVASVGRYSITPRTTIVDLLAQAGGVKETAAEFGYVLRPDETGHISRYRVKLDGLTDLKDVLPTATLLGGDSLMVPRAEKFYVTGEVKAPGTYHIEPDMTVIEGVARAGGINERGSEHRIQVERKDKTGKYKVVSAKRGDLIQAEDIIRVKESIF